MQKEKQNKKKKKKKKEFILTKFKQSNKKQIHLLT